MIIVAAGTWVHAGNEHKRCWIGHRILGSGNGNLTIFKWLAKHLEYRLRKLRQLIKIKNPIMGKTDLTGHRVRASADKGNARDGVMWRAERTLSDQTRLGTKTRNRMNLGGFEGLAERKRRKN